MSMEFTPKQQKLIKLLIENYGNKTSTKSLGEIIIEAGYSKVSAKNPQLVITEEIKEEINPIITKMEAIRTKALDNISDDKLENGTAKDNVYIADTLTKNIQLLSGGKTENVGLETDRELLKEVLKSIRE